MTSLCPRWNPLRYRTYRFSSSAPRLLHPWRCRSEDTERTRQVSQHENSVSVSKLHIYKIKPVSGGIRSPFFTKHLWPTSRTYETVMWPTYAIERCRLLFAPCSPKSATLCHLSTTGCLDIRTCPQKRPTSHIPKKLDSRSTKSRRPTCPSYPSCILYTEYGLITWSQEITRSCFLLRSSREWLASIDAFFMQWKTRPVKQPHALIKGLCAAFHSLHGNTSASLKHPRHRTKEQANCSHPTFMWPIPRVEPCAWPDLLPLFSTTNTAKKKKKKSSGKKLAFFVRAPVWATGSKVSVETADTC